MENTQNKKTVLITGSSSGIGLLTALNYARKGYITYASTRDINSETSENIRNISKTENISIIPIYLDLNIHSTIDNAVNEIIKDTGQIDILINNAGYGYYSSVEDIDLEEFSKQFNTNVIGTLKLIKSVLPYMRNQKKGKIINLSSIMGFSTAPLNAPYSSSKYALECISETLAFEVKPFGIDVVIVEPGDFHTDFIKNSVRYPYNEGSPYFKLYARSDPKNKNSKGGKDPKIVSDLLLKIGESNKTKIRYMVGREVFIRKFLHTFLFDSLWTKLLRFFYKW